MHDLKFIRENPELFDAALKRRGLEPLSKAILAQDTARRADQTRLQELQSSRNDISKSVGAAKQKGENADDLMAQVAVLKDEMTALEEKDRAAQITINDMLATIPNMPFDDVPDGADENGNVEILKWGTPKDIKDPKDHVALGENLKLLDFEAAAKIAGARFTVVKGALAKLERALGQFMLDTHTEQFGYVEHTVPLLVKSEAAYGTANLPKFAEDLFQTTDGRWLIPTAEVSLTNLIREQIIAEDQLPMRLTALTPCFRSEAGSAGRDTRGMLRQHQFYKVEMVSITKPEESVAEHERMTNAAETILQKLQLPYRKIMLCTGDMGFASRKTYDLEVWMPAQNTYREISSCSNCGDFQARRMDARLKRTGQKGTEFVHTLNGSGVAVGRALIAVMENYQQPDGSILIPDVLRSYMKGMDRIA